MLVPILVFACVAFVFYRTSDCTSCTFRPETYKYDFSNQRVKLVSVAVRNGKLTLPDFAASNTSFLKLNATPSWMAYFFAPRIHLQVGSKVNSQYFNGFFSGPVYVDISQMQESGSELTLSLTNLQVPDQQAEVMLFEEGNPLVQRVLVLAPHPDDAEIAAYGLYSKAGDVYIATVTAGDGGPFRYRHLCQSASACSLLKGSVRAVDSLKAAALGGVPVDHMLNLGFPDGQLSAMYAARQNPTPATPEQLARLSHFRRSNTSELRKSLADGSDWEALVLSLEHVLSRLQPDVIVTPHPNLDDHPDHILTTLAVTEAARRVGLKRGRLFLYTNHFSEVPTYPFGPAGSLVSLPPTTGKRNFFRGIYSVSLNAAEQGYKHLSLESMFDLRTTVEPLDWKGALARTGQAIWRELTRPNTSYFRRAVRANELFLVVDMADVYDDPDFNTFLPYANPDQY